jgi:hypothetical protein
MAHITIEIDGDAVIDWLNENTSTVVIEESLRVDGFIDDVFEAVLANAKAIVTDGLNG